MSPSTLTVTVQLGGGGRAQKVTSTLSGITVPGSTSSGLSSVPSGYR